MWGGGIGGEGALGHTDISDEEEHYEDEQEWRGSRDSRQQGDEGGWATHPPPPSYPPTPDIYTGSFLTTITPGVQFAFFSFFFLVWSNFNVVIACCLDVARIVVMLGAGRGSLSLASSVPC